MANDNNIKTFTAIDIEKYHKGLLTAREMHLLEKAALDDPFLADALEGYNTPGVDVTADINELKQRLTGKAETAKVIPIISAKGGGYSFRWMRVAAILVVLLGAGLLAYQFAFNKKENIGIAKIEEQNNTAETTTPTINEAVSDSGTNNTNSQKTNTEININPNQAGKEKNDATTAVGSSSASIDEEASINATTQQPGNISAPITTDNSKDLQNDNAFDKEAKAELAKRQQEADDKIKETAAKRSESAQYKNRATAPATSNTNNRANNDNYYRNMNTFRGRVVDANNIGLPFANVTNTDDNVGTYTDANGYFNLTSTDSELNVQVRSVGFDNRNMQLRNDVNSNNVVLQEDKSIAAQTISTRKVNSERRQATNNMQLTEPEPEDGWYNYDSYLANNLNVPEDFKMKQNNNGEVEVSFEVNKYGEPVNFKIEKSLCSRCDQEAIRLIKEGPKWRRKAKKGRTTVTISF